MCSCKIWQGEGRGEVEAIFLLLGHCWWQVWCLWDSRGDLLQPQAITNGQDMCACSAARLTLRLTISGSSHQPHVSSGALTIVAATERSYKSVLFCLIMNLFKHTQQLKVFIYLPPKFYNCSYFVQFALSHSHIYSCITPYFWLIFSAHFNSAVLWLVLGSSWGPAQSLLLQPSRNSVASSLPAESVLPQCNFLRLQNCSCWTGGQEMIVTGT